MACQSVTGQMVKFLCSSFNAMAGAVFFGFPLSSHGCLAKFQNSGGEAVLLLNPSAKRTAG